MAIVTHPALRQALAVNARKTRDLTTKRVIGAHGTGHLVVRASESCGGDRIVPNAAGITFGPNAQVLTADPGGGNRSLAVISRPPSGSGSALAPREVRKTAKTQAVAAPASPFIALKMTDFSGGNITFDIASFLGNVFVETLYEDVVIPGFPPSAPQASADFARATLMDARSLVGLSGLPDGSIGIRTLDGTPSPDLATMNVIDIDTGAVTSRLYVPGFVPGVGGESFPGWDYFDNKIYFSATYELRTRVQISTFPPSLSSQTIVADENLTGTHFAVAFYAADAIFGEATKVTVWDRMPYAGGKTEAFVASSSPGNRLDGHPQALGLAGGFYWHAGRADTGAIPTSAERDIKLYTTVDIADVGANGFTDFGLPALGAFGQDWNGLREVQYDFNRDRTAILGWPIWTSLGAGRGAVVEIPLTATAWSDATFTQLDTSPFTADAVIADGRAP